MIKNKLPDVKSDTDEGHKSSPSMKGKLLVAMPGMRDSRFERSVIFICAHDKNGAMGIVINHLLDNVHIDDILEELGIASDIDLVALSNIPVLSGGPVEGTRGFILHSAEFEDKGTLEINADCSLTGTMDALEKIAIGQGPRELFMALGYAGWTAGQLDQEILQNTWLVTDSSRHIIFHEKLDEKWDLAVKSLGIDPAMLSTTAGHA